MKTSRLQAKQTIKAKRGRRRKQVVQVHHLSYDPEVTVRIFKGEHFLITLLNRRTKNISTGFIHTVEDWLVRSRGKAVEL